MTPLSQAGGDRYTKICDRYQDSSHKWRVLQPLLPVDVAPSVEQRFAFNACKCNEADAVAHRHCVDYPWPRPDIPARAYSLLINKFQREGKLSGFHFSPLAVRKYIHGIKRSIVKHFPDIHPDIVSGGKMDIEEYLDTLANTICDTWPNIKQGGKFVQEPEAYLAQRGVHIQKRYAEVVKDPFVLDVTRKDGLGKMFLKFESMPLSKLHSAARCIQFRKQKYTFNLARYLFEIDKQYFAKASKWKGEDTNSTKGLNSEQIAQLLRAKFAKIKKPITVGLDAKRWDAHYSLAWLICEHLFYIMHFPGDKALPKMLMSQIINIFYGKTGLKYVFVARRCSGDYNTSTGNNLTHEALQELIAEGYHVEYVVCGDDGLDIIEEEDLNDWLTRALTIPHGFEIKLEEIGRHLRDVVYCQQKFCETGEYCRMVRDPNRVVSNLFTTIRQYTGKARLRYLYQMGNAIRAEFPYIPWFDSISDYLKSQGEHPIKGKFFDKEHIRMAYLAKNLKPFPQADLAVQYAWGQYPQLDFVDIPRSADGEPVTVWNLSLLRPPADENNEIVFGGEPILKSK